MTEAAFTDLIDLAAERLGGAVLIANDEFFAPKESLVRAAPAVWREGEYTDRGKWMDGWETRRRRVPGHDWCIVRLGLPGIVRGVVVDTSFFRGNYPEHCSLEGAAVAGVPDPESLAGDGAPWREILPRSPLAGDACNAFEIGSNERLTHVRFHIYPDGGVARLRVHGDVRPDPARLARAQVLDLAAMENGGYVVVCSDMFFGHRQNLILPGRSTHMGDGWETKRRRGPGHDWTVVRLARRGTVERIELDTDHFKGNAPGRVMLESADVADHDAFDAASADWRQVVAEQAIEPHSRHRFDDLDAGSATHVRLNIYPDGGVARLRVFGRVAP
jgi:allantoicase